MDRIDLHAEFEEFLATGDGVDLGLFGDLAINSPEFTPKDLYELDFYDLSGKSVPPECQGFAPYGYCQVTGKIDFDMGRMNWVQPYEHMAEKCPTLAPDYNRTSNC